MLPSLLNGTSRRPAAQQKPGSPSWSRYQSPGPIYVSHASPSLRKAPSSVSLPLSHRILHLSFSLLQPFPEDIHLLEWIYSWKLLVFKFLSVAFIFYSFRKDIQGGTKTILLLLYPQWLTEYLFGTDASLNICLNEKRNRNLYRETPNKTRMGSVEGESWRQTYK